MQQQQQGTGIVFPLGRWNDRIKKKQEGWRLLNGHETVFSARISSSSSAWYKMNSL
jgi:hypothetical protein